MEGFQFPHLSEEDTRESLFEFTLPLSLAKTMGFDTKYHEPIKLGFFMLSTPYWIELLGFVLVTLAFAAIVGLFLYKQVIEPKLERTFTAYLIGWGVILPLWLFWPILLFRVIDLRSAIFRFLVGGIAPIVCSFRTMEAIYGFCPGCVTKSSKDFMFYYATVPIVARNENGVPIVCSNSKKQNHLVKFLGLLCLTGLLQSILVPHANLNFFGMSLDHEWFSLARYGTWQLYANSALQALLFQMYLTTYLEALVFAFTLLTGYEAEKGMLNPLLESKSPMEFWGKRWNTMIHTVLKNGVYKPLRLQKVHRLGAILGTFVASGVFHEWILWLVFVKEDFYHSSRKDTFAPTYGGALVFFAWQALLMGGELAFGKTKFIQRVARILPQPAKTFLVVSAGIPLAHYFLEPYARSNFFFIHGNAGLPMLARV